MKINNHPTNEDLKELPNIVLLPNHGKIDRLPPYPFVGKREIFCGPNLPNRDTRERKFINTKGRYFDIEDVISQLDDRDKDIELIYSALEAHVSCFPSNLSKINCPKIAFVFDTHHLLYPISTIIDYLKREKFTHMFIYAQPAHLHFFYEAGFKFSAYYPRTMMNFDTIKNKKLGITYIGRRWSSTHPRRSRMVQFLAKKLPKNNIPFYYYNRLPRPIWQKILAKSNITVLCSLNGQVTPQIYACLFAGSLCFIDELSPQTFIYNFFQPGSHLISWSNFDDLLEKLIYYYNHPKEVETISTAGNLQVKKIVTESENFPKIISEFVFENKVDSRYIANNDKRCEQQRDESPGYFKVRVRLYENMQELHRIHETLNLISLTEKNLKPTSDLVDLPRLKITHAFISANLKNEADAYFQSVGIRKQIQTEMLYKLHDLNCYDIGILEVQEKITKWKLMVKSISRLLKRNSLLWVLGNLNSDEENILKKEGFRSYNPMTSSWKKKTKNLSKKICFLFWKYGFYSFPYLTLKPTMKTVSNLNVFMRGWQTHFPYLY
ncbi:MAG: glycosyltransferase [Candidatus Thorarchaeota archaeon]